MGCETLAFAGKGDVYIGKYGQKLVKAGNVGPLEIEVSSDEKTMMDYTDTGGGYTDVIERITGVKGNGTFFNFSKENLAIALRGTASAIASGSVVDEVKIATVFDGLIELDKIPVVNSIVVKDSTGATTYVLGVDYLVDRLGIILIEGVTIAADDVLKISYDSLAFDNVEALTAGNAVYTVLVSGVNEANDDSPVSVLFHKVKFSPASKLGIITDDFASLEMSFKVLCDNTITAAGKSKFFRINKV